MVALLDPHAGGKYSGQEVHAPAEAQFTRDSRESQSLPANIRLNCLDVLRECGMEYTCFLQLFIGISDRPGSFRGRFHVVGAVHDEIVRNV